MNRAFLKLLAWGFAPVGPVFLAYFVWMPTYWARLSDLNPLQQFTALLCGVGILWGFYRMWRLADKVQPSIEEQILEEIHD